MAKVGAMGSEPKATSCKHECPNPLPVHGRLQLLGFIFSMLDVNGKGVLSVEELRAVQAEMSRCSSGGLSLTSLVTQSDADGNGKLALAGCYLSCLCLCIQDWSMLKALFTDWTICCRPHMKEVPKAVPLSPKLLHFYKLALDTPSKLRIPT